MTREWLELHCELVRSNRSHLTTCLTNLSKRKTATADAPYPCSNSSVAAPIPHLQLAWWVLCSNTFPCKVSNPLILAQERWISGKVHQQLRLPQREILEQDSSHRCPVQPCSPLICFQLFPRLSTKGLSLVLHCFQVDPETNLRHLAYFVAGRIFWGPCLVAPYCRLSD